MTLWVRVVASAAVVLAVLWLTTLDAEGRTTGRQSLFCPPSRCWSWEGPACRVPAKTHRTLARPHVA